MPEHNLQTTIRRCEEFLAMTDTLKTISRQEALLKRAEILEELNRVYAELAEGVPSTGKVVKRKLPAVPVDWAKLPLADAVVEYLNTSKKPVTPQTIWAALEAAGCQVESATPVKSVAWALKKLLKNGVVFHAGWGRWHLKSKYSKSQLDRLMKRIKGTGGRDQSEHVEKTKAGMQRARQRGGRPPGQPPKLNAENVKQLRGLLATRNLPISECCKAIGISTATYYLYRDKIEAWQDGDPWPPLERSATVEAENVVSFSGRKKNEALSEKSESASIEPSKGEVGKPNPSLFEPEASHLGAPPAKGREAVPGGGT
jgi:hypothetical protein